VDPEFRNRVGRRNSRPCAHIRVEEDYSLTGLAAPTPLTFFRLLATEKESFPRKAGWLRQSGIPKPGGAQVQVESAAFYNNYDTLLSVEPGAPFSEEAHRPGRTCIPFFLPQWVARHTAGFEIAPIASDAELAAEGVVIQLHTI